MNVLRGLYDYFRLLYHRKFYSLKKIEKYQLAQLKAIYNYAKENSVFYHDLYHDFSFDTLFDYHKLPSINKSIMMDNFTNLNTCNIDKDSVLEYAVCKENDKDYLGYYLDKYVVGLSSGTSGNKGIFITPKEMTERLPAVFLARSGLPIRLMPFKILFMLRVFSQGFEDINGFMVSLNYLSTMEPIEKIIETINEQKINILMAPPSLIRQLLPHKEKIRLKLKRIMTYAEVLEEVEKEKFEKEFNTKVIEIYQASEGQMASACKKGHLHINEDLVYIELYDEEGKLIKKDNQIGHKMIITNLVNYAQPLIRYEMNDMIVLDTKCECGSNFRRIKKILGRRDDIIYFSTNDNKTQYIFPDLFVRWIIVVSDNIREFKVIQNNINEIFLTIDLLNNEDEIRIKKELKNKLVIELKEFNITNPIINIEVSKIVLPKDKNKYKRFESNVNS